jgi:hypothetical protein
MLCSLPEPWSGVWDFIRLILCTKYVFSPTGF